MGAGTSASDAAKSSAESAEITAPADAAVSPGTAASPDAAVSSDAAAPADPAVVADTADTAGAPDTEDTAHAENTVPAADGAVTADAEGATTAASEDTGTTGDTEAAAAITATEDTAVAADPDARIDADPEVVTQSTARPEGGGRAATGDAPAPARQWPLLSVLGTTGLGLLIVGLHPFDEAFRIGTILIGLALIGGAVLRRMVPSVGMLAVRSRFTDMITYGLLGVMIVLLSLMTQPKPWLEIPFLEDVVHSTVP
ncbi:DUF3017 domain-containing protein [Streptomyces sp. NPDC088725]|uniref:DUF3017 domain-containing protein n=1 Tax=Streptomyces sp. NPDC088725 TaxID=3365873 RepID=UPI0038198E3A